MAPIRYVPQMVPTNLGQGLLQEQDRRQGQYDAAFSGMSQAEDQFGQFQVDASDIAGKNYILGQFKDKTKAIVDKYGGDYGAAAKELAREVTKTRANQFFQLAPMKAKLAEEERRLRQQLGPNQMVRKSIADQQTFNPETGEYLRPEDMSYDVRNRQDYIQMLDKDFADIRNKVTEGEWGGSKLPGAFERKVTKGIATSEQKDLANKMFTSIKQNDPQISDEDAWDIANNQAATYVGGTRTEQRNDPNYMTSLERQQRQATLNHTIMSNEMLKAQRDAILNRTSRQQSGPADLYPDKQGVPKKVGEGEKGRPTKSDLAAPYTRAQADLNKKREVVSIGDKKISNPVVKSIRTGAPLDYDELRSSFQKTFGKPLTGESFKTIVSKDRNNPLVKDILRVPAIAHMIKTIAGSNSLSFSDKQFAESIRRAEASSFDNKGVQKSIDKFFAPEFINNPVYNALKTKYKLSDDEANAAMIRYEEGSVDSDFVGYGLDDNKHKNVLESIQGSILRASSGNRNVDVDGISYKKSMGDLANDLNTKSIVITPLLGSVSFKSAIKANNKTGTADVSATADDFDSVSKSILADGKRIGDAYLSPEAQSVFIRTPHNLYSDFSKYTSGGYYVEKVYNPDTKSVEPRIYKAFMRPGETSLHRKDLEEVSIASVNNFLTNSFISAHDTKESNSKKDYQPEF